MKKLLIILICIATLLTAGGCKSENEQKPLSIVTTSFSAYDWTREIMSEVPIEYDIALLGGGVDMHSFSPSADDIVKIASCDLFIYVGGESDIWTDEITLKDGGVAINLIDSLDKSALIEIEGGYDEHIWLSLNNAQILCKTISDALSQLSPQFSNTFDVTRENYAKKLLSLENEFLSACDGATEPSVIVVDRNPFNYLFQNCQGIGVYCAFETCTTDSEASFDMIVRLANTIKKLGAKAVVVSEDYDRSLVDTVLQTANVKDCKVYTLNSMQTVTDTDVQNGANYFDIQKQNLENLKLSIISEK